MFMRMHKLIKLNINWTSDIFNKFNLFSCARSPLTHAHLNSKGYHSVNLTIFIFAYHSWPLFICSALLSTYLVVPLLKFSNRVGGDERGGVDWCVTVICGFVDDIDAIGSIWSALAFLSLSLIIGSFTSTILTTSLFLYSL